MQKRDYFIDVIKIYACALVVLGHFVQSIVKSGLVEDTLLFSWFVQTVYYFHVPLFFICSGFLFQKYSVVTRLAQWKNNTFKKLLVLGVPYIVFTTITWLLKTVFSSSVNDQVDGYFKSVFLRPISPYWYLYALILIFLITPTFSNKKMAVVGIFIALVLKAITFLPFEINVYAVNIVLENLIWFVLGMGFCIFNPLNYLNTAKKVIVSVFLSVLFVVASVLFCVYRIEVSIVSFIMGLVACVATVAFFSIFSNTNIVKTIAEKLSNFTMPVFLMHTIFAAGLRNLLLKFGVENTVPI